MSWKRVLAYGVGASGVLGVGAWSTLEPEVQEGLERSAHFWSTAFPGFLEYRFTEWKYKGDKWDTPECDEAFQKLHLKWAPVAENLTLKLRGFYLKQWQIISTRDEFVPPEYMEFAKRMQDEVPTVFKRGEPRRIVAKSLGGDAAFDVAFEWFDDEPLGVASIGAVHRARLRNGREVAVKVIQPGLEHKFLADIETTISFCRLAMKQHVAPLREIKNQMVNEFDYLKEAQNLQNVYDNVMPLFGDKVVVPRPVMHLCSKEVLVMDYLEGPRLVDGVRAQYRKYAEKNNTTLEALEAEQKAKLASGELQLKDAHEEATRMARLTKFAKILDTASNGARWMYNWTAGWVAPTLEYSSEADDILNLGAILHTLNVVHGHEILVDGEFQADPHPGNILLCPDGRLGLIDMGQVKRIDDKTRLLYAKLIVALAKDDRAAVVKHIREAGFKTKYSDDETTYKLTAFWHDRTTPDIMQGKNVQQFMDDMEAKDPMVDAPDELILAARCSILLRGMSNAFGMQLRTAPCWAVVGEQVLKDAGMWEEDPVETEEAGAPTKKTAV